MVFTKRGLVLGATAMTLTTVAIVGAGIHSGQAFFRESPKELVDEVQRLLTANTWMAPLTRWIGRLYANNI